MRTSIVIPTRDRPRYLRQTLDSILPQARACGSEVIVVDDSGAKSAMALSRSMGVRYLAHERPLGANAARNTGLAACSGDLIIFTDDDISACEGWLQALMEAGERNPGTSVFAGAILPLLEGRPPRSCGREQPPITTLDLGPEDQITPFAWSANMAVRRIAFARVGEFDPTLHGQGEEQDWQERLGEKALYVAAARVMHRRLPKDARLSALTRAAYARGAQARRFDAGRQQAPSARRELITLLGCAGHVIRRRCLNGLTMVAHSAGRLRQALRREDQHPRWQRVPADDFLSGESGTVGGLDSVRREILDRASDGLELLSGRRLRLAAAARRLPKRRVLALGIARERHRALADAIVGELRDSRHQVTVLSREPGQLGKFENLNEMLRQHPPHGYDWLIVFDDDIELPRGFLDSFLFLAQRFALDLAQPAHRRASHAAWQVTRRRPRSVVRETRFVEVGPLTAFSASTFSTLLPFPPLRMGWGLDAHWAAIAKQRGWRCGVIDAVAINHRAAPAAEAYSRSQTIAEARAFLAERPYLPAAEAQRTLAVHRRW
jgi:GT2 family glycosyltransferase